jgi:hypothetical protein
MNRVIIPFSLAIMALFILSACGSLDLGDMPTPPPKTDSANGPSGNAEPNFPPTAPSIKIVPPNPITSQELSIHIVVPSVDHDGDSFDYKYQWYKDGLIQPELALAKVEPVHTAKGQTWKVLVTPNDGKADGPDLPPLVVPVVKSLSKLE